MSAPGEARPAAGRTTAAGEGPVPITVVIAARDEAEEIAACIASVSWAREVIVVENDSTDGTLEEARRAGATAFRHPFRSIGAQRNAAIARATQDWILVVDADERATPALGEEVRSLVARAGVGGDGPMAYRVSRRNWFLGREIRHGGWERDRPVRVFRRVLRYDERPVHEHVLCGDGAVGVLREPLLHTPYASLDEYFEKLGRYARWWAVQAHQAGRTASLGDVLLRPPGRLVSMLVLRGGWRDGTHGVVLATLAAVSVAAKYARLWTMARGDAPRLSQGAPESDGATGAPPEAHD